MRFRKKPVEIEAVQFTGDNGNEVVAWIGDNARLESATCHGEGPRTSSSSRPLKVRWLQGETTGSSVASRASSTPASRTSSTRPTTPLPLVVGQ